MPRIFIPLLIVLFVGISSPVEANPDYILFKDFAVQYKTLDSLFRYNLYELKDSAKSFRNMASLESWAHDKDDIPLKYGVIIMRYKYLFRNRYIANAVFEKEIAELITSLKHDRLLMLEAQATQLLADYYWENNRYALGFENYIKAHDIYSGYAQDEFPAKADFTAEFGSKYYHFRDYRTAVRYFSEAARSNKRPNISLLNTVALCYNNIGRYDSAQYYFNKAYALAEERKEPQWIGLLSGNLGNMYFILGKYDESLKLLEKELEINLGQHEGDRSNAANTLALMSNIYLLKQNKVKALELALQAYAITRMNYRFLMRCRKEFTLPLPKRMRQMAMMDKAYIYLDSAAIAKDTMAKRTNVLILAGAQHNIEADRHLAEIQKFEHDQNMHALTRDILIAGIVLVGILAGLIFRQEKIKYKNRQEQLEAAKKQAETELKNALAQLTVFTESISEKNELIEKFATELGRTQQHADLETTQMNETLVQLQKATILTDEQWRSFQQLFEVAHKGFMERLNKKIPALSPIDKRFMLLSRLKLSKREMAAILGISQEAVVQNRQRLTHKLDIHNTNTGLEEFAATI